LSEGGAGDIAIFVGGIIPEDDIITLKAAGVAEIFTPGTSMADIVEAVGGILATGPDTTGIPA
jgi:methylmalonyl-CoA mutase C-terminal domain/subunit